MLQAGGAVWEAAETLGGEAQQKGGGRFRGWCQFLRSDLILISPSLSSSPSPCQPWTEMAEIVSLILFLSNYRCAKLANSGDQAEILAGLGVWGLGGALRRGSQLQGKASVKDSCELGAI